LAEILRLKRHYQAGYSLRQISKELGVPRETSRLILHRLGVTMRHVHPIFGPPLTGLTPEVAELLGMHAGDGWISDAWGIVVHSADVEMAKRVFVLAQNILNLEPYIYSTKSTISIKSGKKQAKQFFLRYGFPSGRKAGTVSVPVQVLQSNDLDIVRAFLRGLFSTDGCFAFRKKSARCVLQVSSLTLRDGFADLASRLGFQFRRYDYIKTTGKNKLPIHIAYIGQRELVRDWMGQVGSISDAHHHRLSEWEAILRM
jgi:intein/homing endonuclease